MSTSRVAHDPSVADYRATSPRCAQGGKLEMFPSLRAGLGIIEIERTQIQRDNCNKKK